MSFYYPSIFSFIFLAVLYAVVLGLIWLVWVKLAKRKFSGPAAWGVVALVIVAPWLEEFWIAWNFGQLCRKDAGIVVHKVVEVEGFYSDPPIGTLELVKSGGYRFIETKSENKVRRIELGNADFFEQAVARYRQENPKQDIAKKDYFKQQMDEKTEALVYPQRGDSWLITKLDRPSARYHYRWPHIDTQISHKVDKIERVVADSQTEELLARETKYRRHAPWFYIGLDRPVVLCPAPGEHPLSKYGSVFNSTLKPKQSK